MLAYKEKKTILDRNYIGLSLLWIGLVIIFYLVGILGDKYYVVFQTEFFLFYHTLLEFFTIIIYYIIFIISYYTYNKNKRVRLIICFCTFFIVGFVDFLHTMTYDAMPGFFLESSAAAATTYWIIGRLIFTLGLLVTACVPVNSRATMNRAYYLLGSILTSIIIFYAITFHLEKFPAMFIEGQGLTPLKVALEYIMMVVQGLAIFLFLLDYKSTKNVIYVQLAVGLSFGIFSGASFTLYSNVHDSYNMLGHVYKIISSYLICRAIFVNNLDTPYIKLSYAREKIQQYAENLETLVSERTLELEEANQKIIQDLEYAKKIQQSLLPPKEIKIGEVSFISEFVPCQRVSGDFYDIYEINDENIGIFLADVAGHGPSAAMMTIFTERMISTNYNGDFEEEMLNCEKVLQYFFDEFNESNLPDEMHIAILSAVYNKITRKLQYCSAGMNTDPLLLTNKGDVETLDKSKGIPICKLGDYISPEYKKAEVQLEEGDRIIFYTDGLVENFEDNTLLNRNNLERLLLENKGGNGESFRKKINEEIYKTVNDEAIHEAIDDDITYLIMDINK
ncbi:Serine phosphatase RsbU, regulator of sigma subunit [Natronincola peptidivorans]|uniref:Serine phosphatase RsbU, regulator of sigma subunit n=1 Tax=Natronincola peptidivorans TaxID=426128 RepID=A0A1I0BI53_9FIRM|nr:MASE3 domain-containing protein [Natronincola peptidivorans]SET05911.1 Serine phosphatase RsbU, regulator of sigma subunit [Natronincola peptidivorans]